MRIIAASVMKAMIRIAPPHLGHSRGSTSSMRASRSAQT